MLPNYFSPLKSLKKETKSYIFIISEGWELYKPGQNTLDKFNNLRVIGRKAWISAPVTVIF